jgi:L,D-peptidoglycan transpeptidase YkuD (ErfK/YbiS/YcfS/YnhG family)
VSEGTGCRIVVSKRARTLTLYRDELPAVTHPIAIGRNWAADKAVEGDEATPLGEFYVCAKNPRSKFFLSLCLSYPAPEDADRGLAGGLIGPQEHAEILEAHRLRITPPQRTRLGGEIYIHGHGPETPEGLLKESTRGCIALANPAMQEIYDLVPLGTAVRIVE